MRTLGFSPEIYLKYEKQAILERVSRFDKLYLEIGGKLLHDKHAGRVLPGYRQSLKLDLIKELPNKEIIYCINAKDLKNKRLIHDFNLTADKAAIRDLKELKKSKLKVSFVAINLYEDEDIKDFKKQVEELQIKVIINKKIKDYPNNIKEIKNSFKNEEWIPTKSKLVIVTGVASNSGKMRLALNQIFHEKKLNINTGFAKLETFPVWDLPINHPINLAYESATADIKDKNQWDILNKKYYKRSSVNYNRDIKNFRILKRLFPDIYYKSPTDMGINMISKGIIKGYICKKASIKEIYRRFKEYEKDYKKGQAKRSTLIRMKEIIKKLNKK